jgi:F0F1-type ATP synthase membrane subunit b/b'
MLELIGELLHEVRVEITAAPTTFAIEVAQFALLLAIIWVVGFGVGKRNGFLKNMLAERQQRVAADLERSDGSAATLEAARQKAAQEVSDAHAAAKKMLAEARRKAKEEREKAQVAAEREAEGVREHAKQLLEMERGEMLADARERLLEVVGSATRHILSERLSPAEQRALVQRAIMANLESSPAADDGVPTGAAAPGAGVEASA